MSKQREEQMRCFVEQREEQMAFYLEQFVEWCRDAVEGRLVHISEQVLECCSWRGRYHVLLHRAVAESTSLAEDEQQQAMLLMVDKHEVFDWLLNNEQEEWVLNYAAELPSFAGDDEPAGSVAEYIAAGVAECTIPL
jgi:hypothetical protein